MADSGLRPTMHQATPVFLVADIGWQELDGYTNPDLYDRREGGVWNVYVQTQGVRELFKELSQLQDVTMLEPLSHQPYGQSEFVIRDPNGYALVFAEPD